MYQCDDSLVYYCENCMLRVYVLLCVCVLHSLYLSTHPVHYIPHCRYDDGQGSRANRDRRDTSKRPSGDILYTIYTIHTLYFYTTHHMYTYIYYTIHFTHITRILHAICVLTYTYLCMPVIYLC